MHGLVSLHLLATGYAGFQQYCISEKGRTRGLPYVGSKRHIQFKVMLEDMIYIFRTSLRHLQA